MQRLNSAGFRTAQFDDFGGRSYAGDGLLQYALLVSLEGELVERNSFQRNAQARMAVFTWIEGWYNSRRRLSCLEFLSPLNFERSQEA